MDFEIRKEWSGRLGQAQLVLLPALDVGAREIELPQAFVFKWEPVND